MSGWTAEELDEIGAADELEIAALRPDGSLRRSTTIWVVRVGDDLYVRSYRGREGAWFRSVLRRPEGRIRAGGVDRDAINRAAERPLTHARRAGRAGPSTRMRRRDRATGTGKG
jgi:hypothetical protein